MSRPHESPVHPLSEAGLSAAIEHASKYTHVTYSTARALEPCWCLEGCLDCAGTGYRDVSPEVFIELQSYSKHLAASLEEIPDEEPLWYGFGEPP